MLQRPERRFVRKITQNELTMVGFNAAIATANAVKHVLDAKIPGDFVECGVWRGGVSMAAQMLIEKYDPKRSVYMFDTYAGMTEPTDLDTKVNGGSPAIEKYLDSQRGDYTDWCYASVEDVKTGFETMGLDASKPLIVKGDVMETLRKKSNLPKKISVLRLDTDWYESTKLELEILYPLLSIGGLLIIDDYGSWSGARKATDDYFSLHGNRPFFTSLANGGIIGAKCK